MLRQTFVFASEHLNSCVIMQGYMPLPAPLRVSTLARKRQEYLSLVELAFARNREGLDQQIWHQIEIDVPRTRPGVKLWMHASTQRVRSHTSCVLYMLFVVSLSNPRAWNGYCTFGPSDIRPAVMSKASTTLQRRFSKFSYPHTSVRVSPNGYTNSLPETACRQTLILRNLIRRCCLLTY